MNHLSRVKTTNRIAILSAAGVAGGLGSIAITFVYAFTHGSTTVNKMGSLLGMDELAWGRIGAIIPLLLWASLLAFRLRFGKPANKLMSAGFGIASIGLGARVLSEIPQLFINMRLECQSALGIGSWMLYLASLPLLTAGMALLGFGCRRSGLSKSVTYAALFIALSILPTLIAGGILSGISDDSTVYRIVGGALSIPQGLAWSWFAVLSKANQRTWYRN